MDSDEVPTLVEADQVQPQLRKCVPVTIITGAFGYVTPGFLGSGKTTLIMNFLNDPQMSLRIAVILSIYSIKQKQTNLESQRESIKVYEWIQMAQ
jgi:G3E family GTPase